MNKTASMVMKIIGASLAFTAVVCLMIGCWNELGACCGGLKNRAGQKKSDEYEDYADEELYD